MFAGSVTFSLGGFPAEEGVRYFAYVAGIEGSEFIDYLVDNCYLSAGEVAKVRLSQGENALLSWPVLDGDVIVPNHGFAFGDKLARGRPMFEGKVFGSSDGGAEGSIG